jgi:hypothetical protein
MRMTESRRSPVVRLKLHIEATNFRGGTPRSFGSTNARELNCASFRLFPPATLQLTWEREPLGGGASDLHYFANY